MTKQWEQSSPMKNNKIPTDGSGGGGDGSGNGEEEEGLEVIGGKR